MFNSSVGGRKLFAKTKKKIQNSKKFKKIFYLFLFSTVTIYRLYHTHSLGSVEPTIALSESLWSRIVTLIKKNNKKIKISKKKKYLLLFVYCCIVFVISNTDDEIELNCLR